MTTNLPLKHYPAFTARIPDHLVETGETWINDFNIDNDVNKERKESVKNWWMSNLYRADTLYARNTMCFWVNFFSVHINTFGYANRAYRHLETLNNYCLGNFRDMIVDVILKQTVTHFTKKTKPAGEKLADAILNFILGICIAGPDHRKYMSKEKMKRFRKLLNEWDVLCDKMMLAGNKHKAAHHHEFIVDDFIHTSPVKAFVAEINSFIDKIFDVTPVAEHVTKKLVVWLSSQPIDKNADHEFIQSAGNVFKKSGYSIYELVDYVSTRIENRVSTPVEFVIRKVKEGRSYKCNTVNDCHNYPFYHWLNQQALFLGQDASDTPSPSAVWTAYDLSPAQKIWMEETMVMKRSEIKNMLPPTMVHAGKIH